MELKKSNGASQTPPKRKRLAILLLAVAVILLVAACVFAFGAKGRLSVKSAQAQLDEVIDSVFDQSSGNYMTHLLQPAVSVNVNSVKKTSTGYIAKCTVASLDLETVTLQLLSELSNDTCTYAEAVTLLQQRLSAATEMQQDFQVEFIRIGEAYQPVVPESMMVFCNGNIQNVLPQLYEIMLEESSK